MPGVHAELHERHAEPGAGRGVPEVAGQREAQPGADRGPVDRGDRRHLERPDREPGPVERQHPGAQVVDRGVRLAGDPRGVPPEQNAEPSPVTTTARSDRSAASSSIAAAHDAVISSDIALRWSGLSRVSSATPSDGRSTRRWARRLGAVSDAPGY